MTSSPPLDRRRAARQLALQALYQLYMNSDSVKSIATQFLQDKTNKGVNKELFSHLLNGVHDNLSQLDDLLAPLLDRPLKDLDPIEHSILRLGTFELKYSTHLPYKVVINEAVELGKVFGATDGHKYINSVLDKLVNDLRPVEASVKA